MPEGETVRKSAELVVGLKGEIYTTEDIRLAVGIEPRSRLLANVEDRQLILRPKENGEDLLAKPRFDVPPIEPRQLSKLRKALAKGASRKKLSG